MSIMQRDSPVNLSYKVVIVTNASSPVGVVVCKTLLKANALVLGTDTKNKDDSLTASAYSHFQFSPCSLTDDGAAEFLIAEVRKKFNTQRLDALVNLQRGEDSVEMQRAHRRLMDTCIQAMEAGDGGSIVNCTMQAADLGMNDLREQHIGPPASLDKVRCNKIASKSCNYAHWSRLICLINRWRRRRHRAVTAMSTIHRGPRALRVPL